MLLALLEQVLIDVHAPNRGAGSKPIGNGIQGRVVAGDIQSTITGALRSFNDLRTSLDPCNPAAAPSPKP